MGVPSTKNEPALRPGMRIDGRYEVRGVLGVGAMGVVYEAVHLRLDRTFAVKVMSPEHAVSEEAAMRFHREAKAAASVGHPHIVDVTDMGQLDDGTPYLVQELLEGRQLAQCVADEGPFDARRAAHVARQIGLALEAVHARGIVHRDLKPENVMLIERAGDPSFVKVLDFGICTLLEPDDEGPYARLTRTNVTLGTPLFMAPEQFSPSVRLDARTDIHAVGAILYYLLTGKPLYECRDLRHLCMRISAEPPPSVCLLRPDVPDALDALIQRACAKSPEARFQTCAALVAALDDVAAMLPVSRESWVRPRGLADTGESLVSPAAVRESLQDTRPGQPTLSEAPGGPAHHVEPSPVVTTPSFLRPSPSPRRMLATLVLVLGAAASLWLGRLLWPAEARWAPAEGPVVEASAPAPTRPEADVAAASPASGELRQDAPPAPLPEATATRADHPRAVPPAPSAAAARRAGPVRVRTPRATSARAPEPNLESATPPAGPASAAAGSQAPHTEAASIAAEDEPAAGVPPRESSPYRIPARGLREVF